MPPVKVCLYDPRIRRTSGQHFQAAFIVGYFDAIGEMEKVYDRHASHTGLEVGPTGWKLTRRMTPSPCV